MKKLCVTHNCATINTGKNWKGENMAVQLENLYSQIEEGFDVRLLTKSCFHKMIDWIHMVEDMDFVPLLHGDEFRT